MDTVPPKEELDKRWICWKCGDLTLLDEAGLCHWCKPETKATEFYEICCRVHSGQPRDVIPAWSVW